MLRPVAAARFLATDIVIALPDKLPGITDNLAEQVRFGAQYGRVTGPLKFHRGHHRLALVAALDEIALPELQEAVARDWTDAERRAHGGKTRVHERVAMSGVRLCGVDQINLIEPSTRIGYDDMIDRELMPRFGKRPK